MDIQQRLRAIEDRNARVEADKAWEVSLTRRATIAGITYLTAAALLWTTGNANPLLGALIPCAGYVLSTLSLPWIKRFWMR